MCEAIEAAPASATLTLPADVAVALPAIIAAQRDELAPASDEELIGKLVEICGLLGLGRAQTEKAEWQAIACVKLGKLPRGLALEGLEHASTSCDRLEQVVKACFEYGEGYPDRMRARLAKLEALLARGKAAA